MWRGDAAHAQEFCLSSISTMIFVVCLYLPGKTMTLRQSLYPGGVQHSWKYEQRQCFTFSNVGVTLGKVENFKLKYKFQVLNLVAGQTTCQRMKL